MSIINKIFSKKKSLPYIEDYYTNSGIMNGYVVVISKDNILHGPDISRSHDKGLEYLLFQVDPNFKGLDSNNSKVTWYQKQMEGYVLFRLTKMDLSIVYMPYNLSDFQIDMINDIVSQMEDYINKNNKNIILDVSDLEQGELILSLEEFKNYIDMKKENNKKL